ncbi:hypothetical protein D3C75_1284350 [compost metagenome]
MLTKNLVSIFTPLHIQVLDHIIIAGTTYASLANLGQMPRVAESTPNYSGQRHHPRETNTPYSVDLLPCSALEKQADDEWER